MSHRQQGRHTASRFRPRYLNSPHRGTHRKDTARPLGTRPARIRRYPSPRIPELLDYVRPQYQRRRNLPQLPRTSRIRRSQHQRNDPTRLDVPGSQTSLGRQLQPHNYFTSPTGRSHTMALHRPAVLRPHPPTATPLPTTTPHGNKGEPVLDHLDYAATALLIMDYQPALLGFLSEPAPMVVQAALAARPSAARAARWDCSSCLHRCRLRRVSRRQHDGQPREGQPPSARCRFTDIGNTRWDYGVVRRHRRTEDPRRRVLHHVISRRTAAARHPHRRAGPASTPAEWW